MARLILRGRNFDKVARRIQDRALVAAALRDVFSRGSDYLLADVTAHRPSDGAGSSIGPFDRRVDAMRASVSVGSLKSFDVARALNYGKRYHYRKGTYAGKPTRGWFTGALRRRRAAISKLLRQAAVLLEQKLGD